MAWIIGIAIIVVVAIFAFRLSKNGRAGSLTPSESAQERAKALPESERVALSAELRRLAESQYDQASAAAITAGKNDQFAHQVAVLHATKAVLGGVDGARSTEQEMQMETVPFNSLAAAEGKAAVVEYLVWKFFPDKADEDTFRPALVKFRDAVSTEAGQASDGDALLFNMIYCVKCDWQKYIVALTPPELEQS
jgi:hypothetical protein